MPVEALREFFSDPTSWWDNGWTMPTPDWKHNKCQIALWLNNRYKPAWVDSQLAASDTGIRRPLQFTATSAQVQGAFATHEGQLEVEMCSKLCHDGRIADAVDALNLLVQQGFHVHNNIFHRVLRRCIANRDLILGRRIHALSIRSGYEGDAFLATHLIGLYASHGRLEEAVVVFTQVSKPDVYVWASIILACGKHGHATQAIRLYRQMLESNVKPDNRIYSAVLKACATAGNIVAGKEVHAHILATAGKPDIFVQTGLLDMYAKCRSLEDARRVFDRLPDRNIVTWTAMIAGYARQGRGQEALALYKSMQLEGLFPNSVTFICLLQACASVGVGALDQGYARQGMGQEALTLYSSMQHQGMSPPDSVTFVCLLQACGSVGVGALHQGKQLHSQVEERGLQDDVVLGCTLVDMYTKCGSLEDARSVFDKLPDRNMVTWNAMLAGYAQRGMSQEALILYGIMQQQGLACPDSVTYLCLLQTCATVAGLPLGKQLHAQIEERGMQSDVVVGAALVNMYAKCGSMSDSQRVFDSLPGRTAEAWGALIGGYTCQGDSEAVFDLLDRMRLEGIQPNGIIFVNVLTVCSHVGLVDKGREYFELMRTDYGISPTVEHYTCMMDLLGRAGHLEEALQMANTMPLPPNVAVWHALLGACRKWNNVEIGERVFEFAVRLDTKDAASYVLMSNIYSRARMWEEAKEIQKRKEKSGAWKPPGECWWADKGGVLHTFVVGDKKHPESEGLHARL